MESSKPHLAVWAAPVGALIGVLIACVGDVEVVPSAAPEMAVGLLIAIVFSSGSWDSALFLPGTDVGEPQPGVLAFLVSVLVNIPLMILWALLPVLALALDGCGSVLAISVVFAGLGSASCYALTAGMAEGIRHRLDRNVDEKTAR